MHSTAEEGARAMLRIIESAYGVEIRNKNEVVETMIEITEDEQEILTICTALNTWVALNLGRMGQEIEIPAEIVSRIAERIVSGGY